MTTAELKEYLQMMVDLERDLYTEQEMEESIRKKKNSAMLYFATRKNL